MINRIQIVFGKTGTGKTTLVKELIKDKKRLVIIDALNEYDGVVCNDFESFYEYVSTRNEFRVCCRFTNELDTDYVFKIINTLQNICIVVEEAEIYIKPQSQSTAFLYLCRYGRHSDVSIIAVARRSAELSTNVKALCDRIISFKQTLPRDLQSLEVLGLPDLDKLELFDYQKENGVVKENKHYRISDF